MVPVALRAPYTIPAPPPCSVLIPCFEVTNSETAGPREHLIVSMLYLEGRTLPEVRDATGWSVLAIKLLAFRARRKMKKALQHLLQESPR